MKRFALLSSLVAVAAIGTTAASAEDTLDTLLPPPGWLRRNAEVLGIDAATRQKLEDTYYEKEPKYHQLKYKVERLTNQLYPTLIAGSLDEEVIAKQMKSLLDAENELKLYQIHVRISLLAHLTPKHHKTVQDRARSNPPDRSWRGGLTAKVEQIRRLGQQVQAAGGSLEAAEKKMKDVDATFARGNVAVGMRMLDEVIEDLKTAIE